MFCHEILIDSSKGRIKNDDFSDGERRKMIFDNEDEEEGDEDDDSGEDNDEEDLEDEMDDEEYDGSDVDQSGEDEEEEPDDDMVVGAARWKKNIANKAKESFIQRQLNAKNLHSVSYVLARYFEQIFLYNLSSKC